MYKGQAYQEGDKVMCKRWNGEEFMGTYQYQYTDGSHNVMDDRTGRRYNVLPGFIARADELIRSEMEAAMSE